MIYQVYPKLRKKLKNLFSSMTDTMILSCIEGHMGEAWVDNLDNPTMAEIIVGEFVFLAGLAKGEEAEELLLNIPKTALIITESNEWKRLVQEYYSYCLKKDKRYSFYRDKNTFNREYLEKMIKTLPKEYKLVRLNEEIVKNATMYELSEDFSSQFKSSEDYLKRGIGFFILKDNLVISGASTYSIYTEGIEIEIDTLKEYRRKGFAIIVASALILYCLDNNIYPNWDAANLESAKLAKKLGYSLKEEYDVYKINWEMSRE